MVFTSIMVGSPFALCAFITAAPAAAIMNSAIVGAASSADSESAYSGMVTIPLHKQYVPVTRNSRTVMYKTAYFGNISLGLPHAQDFTVVFDTGSGHLFVPSLNCKSETCLKHRRYNESVSASVIPLDQDGVPVPRGVEQDQVAISYGTGEVAGDFAREVVCLASPSHGTGVAQTPTSDTTSACITLRVIFATEMTSEPFGAFEFDGVLGLGLDSLAVHPEFSFFGQLAKENKMEPRFSFFISQNDGVPSEISFGGHDERRMASALGWAPVHRAEAGFWQVQIRGVTIGGEPLELCRRGDCVAIVDSGTSLLGAPKKAVQRVHYLLARQVQDVPPEGMDCRDHPGPDIVFDLGDVKITLGPEDYSRPAGMNIRNDKTSDTQFVCRASLLPVDESAGLGPKAWILGEPVLRKYYTSFDWREKRIGFAPAVQPDVLASGLKHDVFGSPKEVPPATVVVV